MKQKIIGWIKQNGAMAVVIVFAIVALLYLADNIILQRASRISILPQQPKQRVDDPTQGTQNGQVTIFEFGEFMCSACKDQVAILKTIINDYGKNVLLIWKDAPLNSFQPEAKNASIAAHCAANQKKFWEMSDKLFERQTTLGRDTYLAIAKDLNLDITKFTTCIDQQQTREKVESNVAEAQAAQITATPTFIINGIKYEGLMQYNDFVLAFTAQ